MKARPFYDEVAPSYDSRFQGRVAYVENQLACANLPTGNVLDLGCGTGLFLEYRQPKGYVGIDISSGMLSVARAKFPDATFIQSDMAALPLPDAGRRPVSRFVCPTDRLSFDAVVSLFGSFSYCLQPHRCVEEILRVLRPRGTAVIMAMGQRYIHRKSHVAPELPFWTYTARQLRHLFAPLGKVKVRGLNLALDALSWLPMPVLSVYGFLEYETLCRWFSDTCYFLIVEVTKDAKANPIHQRLRRGHRAVETVV